MKNCNRNVVNSCENSVMECYVASCLDAISVSDKSKLGVNSNKIAR